VLTCDAATKTTETTYRAGDLFTMRIEAGQLPADTDLLVTNPALQLMAALMDLPSPSVKAARYITIN
jgi:hypothetical protein